MSPSETHQQKQTALVLEKKFGDFVISTEVPIPKPGKGEVLVKVLSVALNPVDWKIQKMGWWVEEYPAVFGTDIAGEVVELGEGVGEVRMDVTVGDKVFFQGSYGSNEYNGFQQYALADVHTLAKVPSNVTPDEAATIPVALTASYVALYSARPAGLGYQAPTVSVSNSEGRGKYAGTPIVILGGASSVGQYAIQLARLSGFSPIITTASVSKHESYLKSLGATHVVDRNAALTQDHIDNLISSGAGSSAPKVKLVLDAIGSSQTQNAALDILGSGGELVTVLAFDDATKERAAAQGAYAVHALGLKTMPEHAELLKDFWTNSATALLESGDLKPNKVELLPNGLNGVVGGLERLYENRVSGVKLVAHPQETV